MERSISELIALHLEQAIFYEQAAGQYACEESPEAEEAAAELFAKSQRILEGALALENRLLESPTVS